MGLLRHDGLFTMVIIKLRNFKGIWRVVVSRLSHVTKDGVLLGSLNAVSGYSIYQSRVFG